MALRLNNALRTNLLSAGIVGGFGTAAIFRIYDGTPPVIPGDATTASLLVEIPGLSWSAGTDGTAVLTGSKTGTAGTFGTARWVRITGEDGTTLIAEGSIGEADDMFTIAADDSVIYSGELITINTATIVQIASAEEIPV